MIYFFSPLIFASQVLVGNLEFIILQYSLAWEMLPKAKVINHCNYYAHFRDEKIVEHKNRVKSGKFGINLSCRNLMLSCIKY